MAHLHSARSSAALSDAPSYASRKSTSSRTGPVYSHLLYSLAQKKDNIFITTCEIDPVSRFSSCSTSPNSSCESLSLLDTPSQRKSGASSLSVDPLALSAALSRLNSQQTSKSSLNGRYADEHYPLISTIQSLSKEAHASILDAAQAYNAYIRALNSCYNHAMTIGTENVHHFLFFNQTLFNILTQHLKVDEQYLQPLLNEPIPRPRVAIRKAISIHEDNTFHDSLRAWADYIHNSSTQYNFSGDELQAHISSFAPALVQHLHNEVSTLNSLVNENILMPEHLSNIWAKFEETLSSRLDLYTDATLLVGSRDKNFTINGQKVEQRFPRLCMGTTTMVKKWHSRRYDAAWKFCPSDFSGNRRIISI